LGKTRRGCSAFIFDFFKGLLDEQSNVRFVVHDENLGIHVCFLKAKVYPEIPKPHRSLKHARFRDRL
jgi:hypothetical protein